MLELSFCFKRADLYLGFSQRLCWRILSIFVQELSSRPKGFLNVLKIGELRAKFMGFAFLSRSRAAKATLKYLISPKYANKHDVSLKMITFFDMIITTGLFISFQTHEMSCLW